MDTKKLSILILCVIFSISFSRQNICPTFTCGSLPDNECTEKKVDNTTKLTSYTLQECENSNSQCPFNEFTDVLTCGPKTSIPIKLYPGGPCELDDDCFSGKCEEGECAGVKADAYCSKDSDCLYGYSCRTGDTPDDNNKYCLLQKNEGDSCKTDYECINSHGCYKNKCTPYYSLQDGTPVENEVNEAHSFCQSGFEYLNACARLALNGGNSVECSDSNPCTYTNYDGTIITIPENCQCGYNPSGKKYCLVGSGDKEFVKYVDDSKNLLSDTTVCNTRERTGICNQNKKLPSKHFIFLNGNYTNSKIIAENSNRLIESDSCVLPVVYPEFQAGTPQPPVPPQPENLTCAKYTCKKHQKVCAHSHSENDVTNVVLSDVCDRKSFCDVGGDPNEVFYKNLDVNGVCTMKNPINAMLRYPGEECKADADCWSPDKDKYPEEKLVGTCKYGFCQGYGRRQACKETAWCNIGLYCAQEGKCLPLLRDGAQCNKTNECQNHLLCYEGKCQYKWYSQPAGSDVSSKGDMPLEYYCQFGKVSGGKCDFYNNTDSADKKSKLVQCDLGTHCNYTTVDGPMTLKCECGFNENGLSYCPKGHNYCKKLNLITKF